MPDMTAPLWRTSGTVKQVDPPNFKKMTKEDITAILILDLNMYSLAHRFDLIDLMALAVEKIMSKAKYFTYSVLGSVLSVVQEITAPDDLQLRYTLFCRCVVNYEIVELDEIAVRIVKEMSTFGWKLGVEKMKEIENLSTAATNDASDLYESEINLVVEKDRLDKANRSLEETKEQLKKKSEKVNPLQKLNETRKKEIIKLKGTSTEQDRIIRALRNRFKFYGPI